MLLIFLAVAWMLGILAADMLAPGGWLLGGLALGGLALALLGGQARWLHVGGLCLLLAALGGLRYQAALPQPSPRSVVLLAGQEDVLVQGTIVHDPRRGDNGQQLVVQTDAARLPEHSQVGVVEGRLLVNLPTYPAFAYGQRVLLRGAVELPRENTRPGGFDYRAYLARQQIFALMHEPAVQPLTDAAGTPLYQGNPLLMGLLRLRTHCAELILRNLSEPEASIAGGMLLGRKAEVPDPIYDQFRRIGTAHILVISGWHLSMVALVILGAAGGLRLGRRGTFWFALAALWLYALFVGAGPSVLRAAAMASLVVLATATERRSEPWTLLLAACLGLSLWNPHILWDVGFQLSALATAGLFAFGAPIRAQLERLPALRWAGLRWLTDALTATFAAQVFALPLILYSFGDLPLISPLANVLLVPLVPHAMLAGALALAFSLLWWPLLLLAPPDTAALLALPERLLWLLAWLPYHYLTRMAELLAAQPWAAVRLPNFPLWLLLSYYILVGGWWLWRQYDDDAAQLAGPVAAAADV